MKTTIDTMIADWETQQANITTSAVNQPNNKYSYKTMSQVVQDILKDLRKIRTHIDLFEYDHIVPLKETALIKTPQPVQENNSDLRQELADLRSLVHKLAAWSSLPIDQW